MTLKEKENLISQFIVFVNNIPSECDAQIPIATKDERVELLTVKECINLIDRTHLKLKFASILGGAVVSPPRWADVEGGFCEAKVMSDDRKFCCTAQVV